MPPIRSNSRSCRMRSNLACSTAAFRQFRRGAEYLRWLVQISLTQGLCTSKCTFFMTKQFTSSNDSGSAAQLTLMNGPFAPANCSESLWQSTLSRCRFHRNQDAGLRKGNFGGVFADVHHAGLLVRMCPHCQLVLSAWCNDGSLFSLTGVVKRAERLNSLIEIKRFNNIVEGSAA